MARQQTNSEVTDSVDLYNLMLEVKNGMPKGGTRGCVPITKKQAKQCGIDWSFVENAVSILGLSINQHGKHGFLITK